MLAHNRGSGRGDSGGFLHIRIGLDTSRDKSGQGGNTTEPYQERTDYWGRFERRLRNQARIIGKLALQRQHGAVPAELGFEFSRAHFRRTSACPRSRRGFRNRQNALARSRRRVGQCGFGVVVEVYRRTHDRLPCFQAPIAQGIRRLPPIVDFVPT